MFIRQFRSGLLLTAALSLPAPWAWAGQAPAAPAQDPKPEAAAPAQDEKPDAAPAAPEAKPAVEPLPGPDPIPEVSLGPVLKTVPIKRAPPPYNVIEVDSSPLPLDREGIWVLDFAFKPIRMREVELPGKGRKYIYYLWYRVINKSGKPRMFAPQFILVTDTGKRYEDMVIPQAVEIIKHREDPTTPLLGSVQNMGILPPSGSKQGVDDAIFGVAVWEGIDPKADAFKVYVVGLSDAYQQVKPPDGSTPVIRHKALRIDFSRPGDEHNIHEREIRLLDPPYEWTYW